MPHASEQNTFIAIALQWSVTWMAAHPEFCITHIYIYRDTQTNLLSKKLGKTLPSNQKKQKLKVDTESDPSDRLRTEFMI